MAAELDWSGGWALRRTRHQYQPNEVLDCTNFLNDELGALKTRLGHTLIGSVPGDCTSLYRMRQLGTGVEYTYTADYSAGNMTLRRDFGAALGQAAGGPLLYVFAALEEFGSGAVWTYIANHLDASDGRFKKDNGVNFYNWGINAPTVAPAALDIVGGGSLTGGLYTYAYRYVRRVGSTNVVMSNPSSQVQLAVSTSDQVALSNIGNPADPASPDYDPQVTHVEIYRGVVDDQVNWLYEQAIAVGGIGTLTATSSISDSDLGEVIERDNDPPPSPAAVAVHQNRLFAVNQADNTLSISKPFFPDSWPTTYRVKIGTAGEPLLMVSSYNDQLYIFSSAKVYRLDGQDITTYIARETDAPTGLASIASVARGNTGIFYHGKDGLYRVNNLQAANITDPKLYPLFHGETVHGFAPVARDSNAQLCSGECVNGRYYFSYTTTGSTPARSLVLDEVTGTWYPDTRGFRRYYTYRGGLPETLLACTTSGEVCTLGTSTTDNGAAVAAVFQSRDEDENIPHADKQLVEAIYDIDTGGVAVDLQLVLNYADTPTAWSTLTSSGRSQQHVQSAYEQVRAKAIGYRLSASAPCTLYRLLPQVLTLPTDLTALDIEPTDLGHVGAKLIQSLWLDIELVTATSVQIIGVGDGPVQMFNVTHATAGRAQVEVMTETSGRETILFSLSIRANGIFRLWPGSALEWVPLPPWRRSFTLYASQLGAEALKRFHAMVLDLELQSPGTLTVTPIADGASLAPFSMTTVARTTYSPWTQVTDARLLALVFSSTVNFRLWGAVAEWTQLALDIRALHPPASDLGYAGPKIIESLEVDYEILDSAPLSMTPEIDSAAQAAIVTTATNGRYQQSVLVSALQGNLFSVYFAASGRFRLWSVTVGWIPLPLDVRALTIPATDLGYLGAKEIQDVTLDFEVLDGQPITLTLQADGVSRPAIVTTGVSGRYHLPLLPQPFAATLLGASLTSPGRFRVWPGASVGFTPIPEDRRGFLWLPSDLGYEGAKEVYALDLDLELVEAGTLVISVIADGVTVQTITKTTVSRESRTYLLQVSEARLVSLSMTSTGRFRLWGGSWRWLNLPQDQYVLTIPPTDLGWTGNKIAQYLTLDIDLKEAGPVTASVTADGTTYPVLSVATVGRQKTARTRVPRAASGRLLGVTISSPGRWRLYPGSELGWTPLGGTGDIRTLPLRQMGTAANPQARALTSENFLPQRGRLGPSGQGSSSATPLVQPGGQAQRTQIAAEGGAPQRTPLLAVAGNTQRAA